MIYGYARVSTLDQNLDQQIFDLKAAGAEKIFAEKVSSTKEKRPKFQELLSLVKEGDCIYVTRFDRFARTTIELLQEVKKLNDKKVGIKSLSQSWLDTSNQNDAFTQFVFVLFAGIAQLERELTKQRVKEGLVFARTQGRIGGRKPIPIEKQNYIARQWDNGKGEKIAVLARNMKLNISTVRKYCRMVQNDSK